MRFLGWLRSRAGIPPTGRKTGSLHPSQGDVPLPALLMIQQIIGEMQKASLERMKLENEFKIQELQATASERSEDREYERKRKEFLREERAKKAIAMKGNRLRSRAALASEDCKLCRDSMAVDISPSDVALHRQHAGELRAVR